MALLENLTSNLVDITIVALLSVIPYFRIIPWKLMEKVCSRELGHFENEIL